MRLEAYNLTKRFGTHIKNWAVAFRKATKIAHEKIAGMTYIMYYTSLGMHTGVVLPWALLESRPEIIWQGTKPFPKCGVYQEPSPSE